MLRAYYQIESRNKVFEKVDTNAVLKQNNIHWMAVNHNRTKTQVTQLQPRDTTGLRCPSLTRNCDISECKLLNDRPLYKIACMSILKYITLIMSPLLFYELFKLSDVTISWCLISRFSFSCFIRQINRIEFRSISIQCCVLIVYAVFMGSY